MIITLSDFGRFDPELGVRSYMRGDLNEATFQERRRGVSKRPYLQKSVKIATHDDPLKVEHRFYALGAPGEFGFI